MRERENKGKTEGKCNTSVHFLTGPLPTDQWSPEILAEPRSFHDLLASSQRNNEFASATSGKDPWELPSASCKGEPNSPSDSSPELGKISLLKGTPQPNLEESANHPSDEGVDKRG